jgi:hypothetical protein
MPSNSLLLQLHLLSNTLLSRVTKVVCCLCVLLLVHVCVHVTELDFRHFGVIWFGIMIDSLRTNQQLTSSA